MFRQFAANPGLVLLLGSLTNFGFVSTVYESVTLKGILEHRASRSSRQGVGMPDASSQAVVTFTTDLRMVWEDHGIFVIRIHRHGNVSQSTNVRVKTTIGSAEAGSDYTPINKVIKFSASETDVFSYIYILDDHIWELEEYVLLELTLEPNQDARLGKFPIQEITIFDDDAPQEN